MLSNVSKSSLGAAAAACVLLSVAYAWFLTQSTPESDPATNPTPAAVSPAQSTVPQATKQTDEQAALLVQQAVEAIGKREVEEPEDFMQRLIDQLVNDHAHEVANLAFQVSLKGLRDDLVSSYPEEGAEMFRFVIEQAFPTFAEQILDLIAKMDIYDDWLLNSMLDINELPLLQQQGALWEKRYEVFGKEDAEVIWQKERDAKEERRDAVLKTVDLLNGSYDMTMQDRVIVLQTAYEENYLGTIEDLALDSKGVLSQVIFSLDAVQDELTEMPQEDRQEAIDGVRRQIGFDEEQIAWLAQRDQEREARWQNGYDYMAARNEAVSQFDGEALEVELDAIRQKFFKDEASTIKKEEDMLEFFRYERPRVYGRN